MSVQSVLIILFYIMETVLTIVQSNIIMIQSTLSVQIVPKIVLCVLMLVIVFYVTKTGGFNK